ncbi:MAG: multicopper oxidase domain-containing protein [Rhizobiales bacterium]|nr:multicopper oxidase domain-containing protein [Hyphomicrobiales bacterium]
MAAWPCRQPTRRSVVAGAFATTIAGASWRWPARAANAPADAFGLTAAPGKVPLVGGGHPETGVWCFSGTVPGPEIRVRQGERVEVAFHNGLDEPSTVHWHGIRLVNAMDGVPGLTQDPVAPAETFHYAFDVPDAGTFWYHPHYSSSEQVGRGLYGALIVEEPEPPAVDREVVWVIDDWRLDRAAQIDARFDNRHDMTHAGRIGNTVTINGLIPDRFAVRPGERLRLRLINVANARIFALGLAALSPRVIAIDGQPVAPHKPAGGRIVLGPAMRADVVLDIPLDARGPISIVDDFYPRNAYGLVDVVIEGAPVRDEPLDAPIALAPNPLAEPDLERAERNDVIFAGGAMGGDVTGMVNGQRMGLREMVTAHGVAWTINGVAAVAHHDGHRMEPMATFERGQSVRMALVNESRWHHPIHLHGHHFRVLSRNGREEPHRPWQDTVLVGPLETVEIAFVADNPGDWMFHCHVLEHQAAGMMAVIRVT